MARDNNEVTLRAIMLLCAVCNEPLTIEYQDDDGWRNVVRCKPCPTCLLKAYAEGEAAGSEKE